MSTTARTPTGHIPRQILVGIGAVLALTLAVVALARLTGTPPSALPAPSTPALVQMFVLEEVPGTGVLVRDPATREVRVTLAEGQDGFVRGLIRVLGRVRMQHRVPMDAPLRLTRWHNNRLTLDDPKSGWSVELTGFGSSNYATFANLLTALEAPQ